MLIAEWTMLSFSCLKHKPMERQWQFDCIILHVNGRLAISAFNHEYKLRTTTIKNVTFLQESQTTKIQYVIP